MVSSPAKILVGIDGSSNSVAALRWSLALAEATGGNVTALSAWTNPTATLQPLVGGAVPPIDYLAEQAKVRLSEVIGSVPGAADVHQRVIMGAARSALSEASEDHDVLVLGRTGHGRLNRLVLGSIASYNARNAQSPVVIVRDSFQPTGAITVAVDASPCSMEALLWALSLGPDHEVVAVYSHDERQLDDLPLDDQARVKLDASAEELLGAAVQNLLDENGIDASRVTLETREGDPRTTVVEQADPDHLLVLGAQGHSGLARWALGSLADFAVDHAPGTVAVWRPKA